MSPGYSTQKLMLLTYYRHWSALCLVIISLIHLTVAGCSTWQVPTKFDNSILRARAVTEVVNGVRIRAAVLSTEDSLQLFGVNINKTGVQPVWIEVENTTQQMLWLLRSGTDPDIFSPLEVAWSFHATFAGETNAQLDEHFDALGFQNPIAPGSTHSGILFTNPDQQTKFLNVDLLGEGHIFPFTLFPPVPDDAPDEEIIVILNRFADAQNKNYQDLESLRNRLERLPCCSTGKTKTELGDPVNVIVIGEFTDIISALVRRGFRKTELDVDNTQRLFGRKPDAVVRKTGQGGVSANWMRMWLAPFLYQGKPIFLAQTGRPVGGRFKSSINSDNTDLILHPNVDEVRNLLIQDMMYSGGLGKLAFVTGVGASTVEQRRNSLNNSYYFTDGLRAVLFLETRPLSLSDLEILDWDPYLRKRESDTTNKKSNAKD